MRVLNLLSLMSRVRRRAAPRREHSRTLRYGLRLFRRVLRRWAYSARGGR
jgi:hypothetical protein